MSREQKLAGLLDEWQALIETVPQLDSAAATLAATLAAAAADAVAAVSAAGAGTTSSISAPALWRRFLETTGEQRFLSVLADRPARYAWAETAFAAIRQAEFGLLDLLAWRVRTHPDRVFLQDLGRTAEPSLTYRQTERRLRHIAAHFLGADPLPQPRACVGILAANTLDGALCDLACLCHDIPVAPLNIQEDTATLTWICDRLGIADLVVDDSDRLQLAMDVRDRVQRPFVIHLLQDVRRGEMPEVQLLEQDLSALGAAEAERRLAARPRLGLDDPGTVLFTSGSTGRPKGTVFTPYHLVSKRFARAAALPAVGDREVLLAYLPLYHTFGRYLELLGMLYWGGTYVFAGNPSSDALLTGMRKVRPTGLVSVPLRWQQLRERAEEGSGDRDALDAITGGRLRWGLSAAGWLAPETFRWFAARGVALCSGFGMTEGTGGLTMTPPDEYSEDSVGVPLPGVKIRLGDEDELLVAGPYVARYLRDDAPNGDLRPAPLPDGATEYWLSTGDLFRELPGGHLQIVDRIKDIYKNNRGQTVAPRKAESLFSGVPGVARTFLAGDGRPFNVLLIVPDRQDPVLRDLDESAQHLYFRRVIRQANLDLAAYERVVNFAVLDRDFSQEHGELTAKGSLRRKAIAANFQPLLDGLYRRRTLTWGDRRLLIPDWILRDLGLLEDELVLQGDHLCNRRSGAKLEFGACAAGWLRLGDLQYLPVAGKREVDLGLFARQPLLWVGNPSLQAFLPCRDVWETRLTDVAEQVRLPDRAAAGGEVVCPPRREDRLGQLDALCRDALFGEAAQAGAALAALAERLPRALPREALLIRRRLEALADHPRLEIRCQAYRILVMDEPEPDYGRYLPAFVQSGKPFLCPDTIRDIAQGATEPRRLLSFRRRLHSYRRQLPWPATPAVRGIFKDLLRLLVDFARHQPDSLSTVRRELCCWILLRRDAELAGFAETLLEELTAWHRQRLAAAAPPAAAWSDRVAFQDGLTETEIVQLTGILAESTFLAESAALLFGISLAPADIAPRGIWVSRTLSQPFPSRYRVSLNTRDGRHYDLLLILRQDLDQPAVKETFQRMAAIRAWPTDAPVVPRVGALRADLGTTAVEFVSGLTVWDRIRQHAATAADVEAYGRPRWRHLFLAGMTAFLNAWLHSGREIVPGMIHPDNVVIPEHDWQRDRLVISLAGWRPYTGPLDLARPLLQNFLRLVVNHYPTLAGVVDEIWLAEAVAEALGPNDGRRMIVDLIVALERADGRAGDADLLVRLREAERSLAGSFRPTLAVEGAIRRYNRWAALNPDASPRARSDQLESLVRLYRLDREGEPALLTLFAETYLQTAPVAARQACRQLIARLFEHPGLRAARTVELGDLQAALPDANDREALGRLAFPQSVSGHRPAVQAIGDRAHEHVILVTEVSDDHGVRYLAREPRDAAEMGRLYRLFLQSGFALAISDVDRHLLVVDGQNQLVGGVVWRTDAVGEPHLDGVVVMAALRGRGLARVLLDDLCRRLANEGHRILRTHFSLQSFFARLGFAVDQRRGGLVRRLL